MADLTTGGGYYLRIRAKNSPSASVSMDASCMQAAWQHARCWFARARDSPSSRQFSSGVHSPAISEAATAGAETGQVERLGLPGVVPRAAVRPRDRAHRDLHDGRRRALEGKARRRT